MLKRHLLNSSRVFLLLIFALKTSPESYAADKSASVDLVVYGGTASGVMTAYSAAKEGLHVVLLEPREHLGGMVTGREVSPAVAGGLGDRRSAATPCHSQSEGPAP